METIEKGQRVFEVRWGEIATRSEIFSGDLTDIALRLDKIIRNLSETRGHDAADEFIEGFVAFCQRYIACFVDLLRNRLTNEEYLTFPVTSSVSFREGVITSGGVIRYLDAKGEFCAKGKILELKSAVNQIQMYVTGLIAAKEIKNLWT